MAAILKPDLNATIKLDFEGGITENEIDSVPKRNGLYVAFVCDKLLTKEGCYTCKRIAYIGKAEGTNDLHKRIQEHFDNDHELWAEKCRLSPYETFVYVYAIFEDTRLADVESALIYRNQPIINTQHRDRYNGNSWILWINCEGNIGILNPQVVVARYIGE